MPHRARRRRRREGDGGRSPNRCRSCSPPTSSTNRWCARKSTGSSPTTGSPAATCRRAPSCRTKSGSKKAPSATRSARSAATAASATPGVHGTRTGGRQRQRHRTGRRRRRPRSAAKKASKSKCSVQNQGESTENGVTVSVTVEGNTVQGRNRRTPGRRNRHRDDPADPDARGRSDARSRSRTGAGRARHRKQRSDLHAAGRIAVWGPGVTPTGRLRLSVRTGSPPDPRSLCFDPRMRIAYLGPAGTFTEDALGEALPDGRLRAAADGDDPRRDPGGRAGRGGPGAGADRELARGLGPADPRHPRLRGRAR